MENEKFKELYEEAKIHEKQANLSSLITRNKKYFATLMIYITLNWYYFNENKIKSDLMMQETNFYLILTKMLAELKE